MSVDFDTSQAQIRAMETIYQPAAAAIGVDPSDLVRLESAFIAFSVFLRENQKSWPLPVLESESFSRMTLAGEQCLFLARYEGRLDRHLLDVIEPPLSTLAVLEKSPSVKSASFAILAPFAFAANALTLVRRLKARIVETEEATADQAARPKLSIVK